jgi:opacity protein-like surface antigen
MRRAIGVLAVGFCLAVPSGVRAGGLDLRVGAFFPELNSNLFTDPFDGDFKLYNVSKSDFRGPMGGIEYNMRLARNVELGVHLDGYGRSVDTSYRDFVRSDDSEIRQTLKLNIVPVGVSLRIVPTGRHVTFAPYAAVGADLFFWHYEEFGDFIDFQDPGQRIIADSFVSDGVTPGFHAAGGVRVSLSHDIALVAEGRYQWAKEKDMGSDFKASPTPNELDLTGPSATLGIHIRF